MANNGGGLIDTRHAPRVLHFSAFHYYGINHNLNLNLQLYKSIMQMIKTIIFPVSPAGFNMEALLRLICMYSCMDKIERENNLRLDTQ